MKSLRQLAWALAVLIPVVIASCVIALLVGPARLSLGEVMGGLGEAARAWLAGEPTQPGTPANILVFARMPRILLAAGVGGMVSAAGALFQSSLRNPLADPLLLGVAGGAAVGAAVVGALGIGIGIAMQGGAVIGALVTMGFVLWIAAQARRGDPATLLLAGVVASAFHSATLMMILSLSPRGGADQMIQWSLGDFSTASIREGAFLVLAVIVLLPFSVLAGRTLNLLSLGDDAAMASGVDARRSRALFYTAGAALTAVSVAAAGIVGFIGLVMPHAARRLFGPDHRVLVPSSTLLGAGVAVLADTAARSAVPLILAVGVWLGFDWPRTPIELPVGSVTAFLGAPFFLFLLVRHARAGR